MASMWKSAEDVLDYAIKGEEQAVSTYTEMAKVVTSPKTSKLLMQLSVQEVSHKRELCAMKSSHAFSRMVLDLVAMEEKIEPQPMPAPDMTPEQAMAFAIQAEKDADLLYTMLADSIGDGEIADTFATLAKQERAHARSLEALRV